mmetsp:Transcript_22026/g.33633  ORF Transcript_22026/g.33633 Transcript_22026/m.33633 type:complete len:142 (-) Transcript_22026:33-458(-)
MVSINNGAYSNGSHLLLDAVNHTPASLSPMPPTKLSSLSMYRDSMGPINCSIVGGEGGIFSSSDIWFLIGESIIEQGGMLASAVSALLSSEKYSRSSISCDMWRILISLNFDARRPENLFHCLTKVVCIILVIQLNVTVDT